MGALVIGEQGLPSARCRVPDSFTMDLQLAKVEPDRKPGSTSVKIYLGK